MSANDQFCTVADVKEYVVLGRNTVADNGVLQRIIERATKAIQRYLNDAILLAQYTEIRDGTGTNTLVLANSPVVSVSSLSLGIPGQRTALVADVDYIVTTSAVKILTGAVFPRGVAVVEVIYTAGYVDVPLDIVDACAKWVALKYKQLERAGQLSVTQQGQTVTFDVGAMPQDVKLQLDSYKRVIQLPPNP